MKNLPEFTWWGGSADPPENFKTSKQCHKSGFKPISAVGRIETKKYTVYLYDIFDSESVKPKRKLTPSQLESLAKARRKAKFEREYREWNLCRKEMAKKWDSRESNRAEMVIWAKKMIKNPYDVLIFDTETTGLNSPEILDIALVDLTGKSLLKSKICPKTEEIESDAFSVHGIGITKESLQNAPKWEDIAPLFYRLIEGRILLSYNFFLTLKLWPYRTN